MMMKKVSTTVTEYIVNEIKNEKYVIGSKLPSERELMEILGVGRSSVREALNTLVDMDVLEKRMGIGVFVKKIELNHLVDTFVASALMDTKVSSDLLDFRFMLEVEMAGKAAELASKQALQKMEQALMLHVEAIENNRPTIEPDTLFHRSIALATDNKVLLKVYDFISDLIYSFKLELLKVESKQNSLEYHQKIYSAIKSGEVELARKSMGEHLLDVTERYKKIKEMKLVRSSLKK
ncbi:transcriptional regulator [Alkalihalobacillus alcalophilus ATCC 27647 = CGMCC 1.3604]|uniref:Transcriptional regulator n=1 Tax=Alkalihalobacillus alcalophilus ATCC 27647 = CGMCC 1.3604 TaxID=1218173 RepID=A0A4S4K3V7_ALKAL|nr:FadR/GntR family transcriptional regulator [Alkalihalobacillus alcalophilus]MED1562932.1 FadR/GntR family transcriptional regulator [Alkalihalobacillus alcalophilus]THG91940.1 transcriptional regulator [Alkalihalobacillus alcalophilus ATCC 27647 = CGMCC 1.3604]